MKVAIAFVLLFGLIAAQAASPAELCIVDIKSNVATVKSIIESVKEQNVMKVILEIVAGKQQIEATVAHCKAVQPSEFAAYVYGKMTVEQKACLTDVLSVIFTAQATYEDVKNKKINEALEDVKSVINSVQSVQKTCLAIKFDNVKFDF